MDLRAELTNWLYGGSQPRSGQSGSETVLGHRRVYIVPSRLGLLYAGTLAILLVGSINYALSLGFALTFLLAGMGIAAMVQTTRNLVRLAVRAGRSDPVFAGDAARFRLGLANAGEFDRPEILVRHLGSGAQLTVDVDPKSTADALLEVPAPRRGWLPLGRVMLETRFPVGLFRAWSYVETGGRCLVYPRPETGPLPPPADGAQAGGGRAHARGSDDFSGLRGYQPADSPRHVAWKTSARSESMLTKQFAGDAIAELWFDLREQPAALGLERRLSRIVGLVLAAERSGALYGLRLAGNVIEPGCGEAHRAACLEALALYDAA